jgi:hypothetical protein
VKKVEVRILMKAEDDAELDELIAWVLLDKDSKLELENGDTVTVTDITVTVV